MTQGTGIIKWPGDGGAARKSIYHSFLVREGRMQVKFKGDPRDSKYPGKPPFVYIQVPGDPNEYALNLEPDTVEAVANAPKNQWVWVTAYGGGKDDPKSLFVEDGAGPVLPGSEADDWEPVEPPANPQGKPMSGPPPMYPEDKPATKPQPYTPPKANGGSGNAVMTKCWGDAVSLVRADFGEASADAAVEAASRIAISLFIQQAGR